MTTLTKVQPMDSKRKSRRHFKRFCQYFGVPEKLTLNGSKKNSCKGTTFMKEVHGQGIDYYSSEPDLHKHNSVLGVIMEVRLKFYRRELKKRLQRQLWEYGVSWVSEIMPMPNYSANSANVGIPLTNITIKTVDISKYIDFGFYDKVWFKYNDGMYPSEPWKLLGISHWTIKFMGFHIFTHTERVISISTVQRVTSLEFLLIYLN